MCLNVSFFPYFNMLVYSRLESRPVFRLPSTSRRFAPSGLQIPLTRDIQRRQCTIFTNERTIGKKSGPKPRVGIWVPTRCELVSGCSGFRQRLFS